MSVILTPHAEAIIEEKIANGPYRTFDEVIEEALRLLDARDRRVQEIRESVVQGLAAIERGEGIELTPELLEKMGEEATERAKRGELPHPDVCP